MEKYKIRLIGCDDETEIILELLPTELELLQRVELLVNETSGYACMPRLKIKRYEKEEEDVENASKSI